MNLKKSVCKRCWKKCYEKYGEGLLSLWDNDNEQLWKKEGIVLCPWDYSSSLNSVSISKIPKNCPYALEHLTQEEDTVV